MPERLETHVWNRTDAKIEVKEGNGGIFNLCTPLECNTEHKVRIESDTTYRTFKVLRMGDTMNSAHYVDLDSDYLTDHKIVYIRINEQGKCYKDGIPREARPVTKEIVNLTAGETITVKETADLGHQRGRLTLLKILRPGESCKVDVVDGGNAPARVLRYSVEITEEGSQGSSEPREITEIDFKCGERVEVSVAEDGESLGKRLVLGQKVEEPPPKRSRRSDTSWFKMPKFPNPWSKS